MENITANITQEEPGENPIIQSIKAGKLDSHTWQLTEWRSDDSEFPGEKTFRPDGESGLLSEGNYFYIGITPSTMPTNIEGRYREKGTGTWNALTKQTQTNDISITFVYPEGIYNRAVQFQIYDSTTQAVYDLATCRFINEVNE